MAAICLSVALASWAGSPLNAAEELPPGADTPVKADPATDKQVPPAKIPVNDGNELLQAAMVRMAETPLTARVRQSGGLLGQTLVGAGLYSQMVDDQGEVLTRLQMDCQFETQAGSYLQIHTGAFQWLQRRLGEEEFLSRIDVRRVMRELGRRGRGGEEKNAPINRVGATLAGGMPGMLASLLEQFEFGEPLATQYREMQVYEVVGTPRKSPVPPFAPSAARVVLGREDLVPYSIVYQQEPSSVKHASQGELRTEFYEVAPQHQMEASTFRFQWDGHEFSDITPAMTQRLRWVIR